MSKEKYVESGGKGMAKLFFCFFAFWAVFSLAILGGVGYAVYWGLSIAEDAVEQSDGNER